MNALIHRRAEKAAGNRIVASEGLTEEPCCFGYVRCN